MSKKCDFDSHKNAQMKIEVNSYGDDTIMGKAVGIWLMNWCNQNKSPK